MARMKEAELDTTVSALAHDQAAALAQSFLRFARLAMATRERFRISYWDVAVIEAARAIRCEELLSKDSSDRQDHDGVVVTNPFRGLGE